MEISESTSSMSTTLRWLWIKSQVFSHPSLVIVRGGHNPAENPDTISQLLLALFSTSTATCHMVLIITRLIVCFRTPFTETVDWTNFKTPPPYEEWENKNWETKYAKFQLHNYDLVDSLTVISYILYFLLYRPFALLTALTTKLLKMMSPPTSNNPTVQHGSF